MKSLYGLDDSYGYLSVPGGYDFTAGMKEFCGKTYTIEDARSDYYKLEGIGRYVFTDAMVDLSAVYLPKPTHKVGQMVTVRSWESMAKEFTNNGTYLTLSGGWYFTQSMKRFCGKTMKVAFADEKCYSLEGAQGWYFTEEMVEDAKPVKQVARANGSKVQIRSWDSMKAEYGLKYTGSIAVPLDFTEGMRQYCGSVFTISYSFDRPDGSYGYRLKGIPGSYSEGMFEKGTPTVLSSASKEVALSDLKEGMQVRIKSYDALVAEYGKNAGGDVPRCPGGFAAGMKAYCGKVYTIKSIGWSGFKLTEAGVRDWHWSPQMLEEIVADAAPALVFDHVVVDEGWIYNYYKEMATKLGATKWKDGGSIKKGTKVALVRKSTNSDHCLVTDGTIEIIICSLNGIKKASEVAMTSEKIDGASFGSIMKSLKLEREKEFVKEYSFIKDSSGSMRSEPAIAPAVIKSKEENTFMGDVYASMATTGGFDAMLDDLLEGLDDVA